MSRVLGDSVGAIGDTKQSMLTLSQFQALYGPGWVLANGGSCAGSKYASITGNSTVPDARGTFLRAKDNGRGLDPSGDLALGSYTGDTFGSHSHSASQSSHNHDGYMSQTSNSGHIHSGQGPQGAAENPNPGTASSFSMANFMSSVAPAISVSPSGSSETAPKHTTVNIFIRIN